MPPFKASRVPITATGLVGGLVNAYLSGSDATDEWINVRPRLEAIREYRQQRAGVRVDRDLLHRVLKDQYERLKASGEEIHPLIHQRITELCDERTFTITTGHQIQVAGGPLFFTYKILSAIRLADELNRTDPQFRHVPIIWLATEDHDMAEVSSFRVNGQTYTWESGWQGAAGRATTEGLDGLFSRVKEELSHQPYGSEIAGILESCYLPGIDLSLATQRFVNRLFGRFGLIVLDADHPELKRSARSIFADELFKRSAEREVSRTLERQSSFGEPQVTPRPVNLFYLTPDQRRRIDPSVDGFVLADTQEHFNAAFISDELEQYPERFSPNVLLRPVYQEYILPDLAYIGGPSEVAYWLELKGLFEYHQVPFPAILLRNSFLLLDRSATKKADRLGRSDLHLLQDLQSWIQETVLDPAAAADPVPEAEEHLERIYGELVRTLSATDATLGSSVQAELQKAKKGLLHLQEKWRRSLKRKEETVVSQLRQLDEAVRPGGGFQERSESLITFYAAYGPGFIDSVLEQCLPVNDSLTVLREQHPEH